MSYLKPKNSSAILFLLLVTFSTPLQLLTAPVQLEGLERLKNRDLERASEKLHYEINGLFEEGRYWECARDLIILIDFYPNYSKIDNAIFTLGECLYEVGLVQSAAKIYRFLIQKHIRSRYLGHALLGLQRIEYDRGDFGRCIEFYNAILRGSPKKDILNCAKYYAGLSYYQIKDYPKAIELLSDIENDSPYFDYGLYTKGLSLLRMKKVKRAVKALNDVLRLPVVNDERRSVVDETRLTLGYLYYELEYYNYALKQFLAVSSDHKNYQDALLAAGWAAVKMKYYGEAVGPLTDLLSQFPDNLYSDEALFLLGRCYLKLEMYDEALKIYDHILDLYPEKDFLPVILHEVNQTLADERQKAENINLELLMLESRLLEVLPIGMDGTAPDYLKQEKKKLHEIRTSLLERIQKERQSFKSITNQMDELEKMAKLKESRKNWRAFAEYGKSRALFMKRSKERN
ncbi:tetratricopeptide repeat protein [candidate division KSB1 bacterium]|nr:tetratricopeptide repeat protein [candidate division KSB1 bacterium]